MSQTLCANLRGGSGLLEELNKAFSSAGMNEYTQNTSSVVFYYFEPRLPEINNECSTTARQVRYQFSKVINDLTTVEAKGTTIAEEWPVALEFKGWASDDCIEFCNSHGLIDDLRKCKRALKEIFSNIKKTTAGLDYYQEDGVNDDGYVVLRVEIESDRETYRNEYKSWVNWTVEHLSDESRMLITVSVDRL